MGWQKKLIAQVADADGTRLQYGALCWRPGQDGTEVLLITSRDTGRWVIPKGWPIPGLSPEAAAAQEAWEEAGVSGEIDPRCIGRYGYLKSLSVKATVACAVSVFVVRVEKVSRAFPEAKERQRNWYSQSEAAGLVDEPELALIISAFLPPFDFRAEPITGDDAEADRSSVKSRKRKGH
jgi:8-oxo-dGTP pyrophosphatase MutT (NUDIX family)